MPTKNKKEAKITPEGKASQDKEKRGFVAWEFTGAGFKRVEVACPDETCTILSCRVKRTHCGKVQDHPSALVYIDRRPNVSAAATP